MTEWKNFTFDENPVIRVGISSCLLGEMVRYNGGHAHDSFTTTMLGPYVEWVPVCPEVEIGMGAPRENVRLTWNGRDQVLLIGPKSGTDYTGRMVSFSEQYITELAGERIHGYILKKNSPTCGMERVKIYDENAVPQRNGTGLFATELLARFPLLPVEEEGRLRDIHLRENFIERVFAYYRIQEFLAGNPSPGDLVGFHTRHKLTLLSHHQERYRELGRLVADAGNAEMEFLAEQYATQFMTTSQIHATRQNHTNVLHHILGYFTENLDPGDKEEMVSTIDNYHQGLLPLIVPLTLLKHHLRRHPVDWLETQVYLTPYPRELKLRNLL